MLKSIVIILLITLFSSCSNFYFLSNTKQKDLYTNEFLTLINEIKKDFSKGKSVLAITKLKKIEEKILRPTERAFRDNLLGVIYFGDFKYEQSLTYFEHAYVNSILDKELSAQIKLNIASTKFKLGFIQNVYSLLKEIKYILLVKQEEKKFHRLNFNVSNMLDKENDAISSLILYFRTDTNIINIKNDSLYEKLLIKFQKLDDQKAFTYLNNYSHISPFIVALLGIEKVKRYLIIGKNTQSNDLAKWLKDEFIEYKSISQLITQTKSEVDLDSTLERNKIGIVLPLTGSKKKYGLRALKAISIVFEYKLKKSKIPFELIIKDSESSPAFGALKVIELIKKDHVAAIIGGLTTREAVSEFKKARSFGALFISLSTIYIPSIEKNHLLIELPGSLESQFNLISKPLFQQIMGKRIVVMYPTYNKGEIFFDEIWNRRDLLGLDIVNVAKFYAKDLDFSKTIRNLLDLKFVRERQEELDLFQSFKDNDRRSWRGRQLLQPNIDFDWIYVLSSPRQALQIIPTFPYNDARNIKIVGGPMWRSNTLINQNYRSTNVYYIGDNFSNPNITNPNPKPKPKEERSLKDSNLKNTSFVDEKPGSKVTKDVNTISNFKILLKRKFEMNYKMKPKLLEYLSFEGLNLVWNLLNQEEAYSNRQELSEDLKNKKSLEGLDKEDSWVKFNSLWTKKMHLYKLKNKKIQMIL